jgi:ankyrin repeat domain-containing protein 13
MLTCKLSHTNLDYIDIVKLFLNAGADPLIKNEDGWSCLDEAVSQVIKFYLDNTKGDVMLITVLMDGLIEKKNKLIKEQREQLAKILNKTPDFYMEMKWDFDSPIIPLLSKLAPSDTFKIWKFKNYLRLDNSLVSFKKLKAKKRNMSLIYNEDVKIPKGVEAPAPLFSLYRDKSQYTNILVKILMPVESLAKFR